MAAPATVATPGPARPGDVERFALSPVRARIHLAWAPWTDVATGVAELLAQLAAEAPPEPVALVTPAEAGEASGPQAVSFVTTSPVRTAPGTTTRAFTPLRCSSRPTAEFTKRSASSPKRALNFLQPRWGWSVISMTAVPSDRRVPAGRLASLRSRSR